jgi:hypothetical protein
VLVVIPTRLAERSYDGARRIGRDIADLFHVTPEVTVSNTVVLQQQSAVFELATVSQHFQHHYIWTNTWFGSTKKVDITGGFDAKAGFDLDKRFSIAIDGDVARVTLPPPELLSIESLSDVQFKDENGIINWVNMDDRNKAMNAFTSDARRYAQQATFVDDARKEMEKKLRTIFQQHGKEVIITYVDEPRIEAR